MNAYAYFKSHDNYFWHWEEEGNVMAIPNGNTIAYKKHITEVLKDFAGQGFPPFGTLLVLLIALSLNGAASLNSVYSILNKELDERNKAILDEAMGFLKLLTKIPAKYKMGGGKMNLLQSVFNEFQHRVLSPKNSEKIFEVFTSNAFHPGQITIKQPFEPRVFYGDFRVLGLLAGKFKTVEDILATLTSLPDVPEELEIVNEPKEEPEEKDLIEELIEDEKTFRVGTLIKRIWSGLNIPVHSALPSAQPLGGVSDLTNKGTFDRLLISEFANDDLLFLSRIANNEALYIHREIPPVSNNLQRIILVDISLKNWGTPKIIAYAITLAIAKHPKTDIECTAFAFGNSFYPLALDTVDNIVDGLQLLGNGLHGVQGLEAFFKEYPDNRNREIFLITAASTLNQIGMVKALNDYFSAISYWIHTDAEGNIDLYKKQQKSKKHVQHMQLPLRELWKREHKPDYEPPKTHQKEYVHYPMLFRELSYPKKVLSTDNGELFLISDDNALLKFYGSQEIIWKNGTSYIGKKGWLLIYTGIPHTDGPLEIGILENGDYVLLIGHQKNKNISLLNISDNKEYSIPFLEWEDGGFVFSSKDFIIWIKQEAGVLIFKTQKMHLTK